MLMGARTCDESWKCHQQPCTMQVSLPSLQNQSLGSVFENFRMHMLQEAAWRSRCRCLHCCKCRLHSAILGWPAGVHAVKLEELERRLRNDLMHEAIAWHGRLLLHRDVTLLRKDMPSLPDGQPPSPAEEGEDITQKEDTQPNAAVTAFWDSIGSFLTHQAEAHACLLCSPQVGNRFQGSRVTY